MAVLDGLGTGCVVFEPKRRPAPAAASLSHIPAVLSPEDRAEATLERLTGAHRSAGRLRCMYVERTGKKAQQQQLEQTGPRPGALYVPRCIYPSLRHCYYAH